MATFAEGMANVIRLNFDFSPTGYARGYLYGY
jgi:hypothetical protein